MAKDKIAIAFFEKVLNSRNFDLSPIRTSKEMNYFSIKMKDKSYPTINIGCLTKSLLGTWLDLFLRIKGPENTQVDSSRVEAPITTLGKFMGGLIINIAHPRTIPSTVAITKKAKPKKTPKSKLKKHVNKHNTNKIHVQEYIKDSINISNYSSKFDYSKTVYFEPKQKKYTITKKSTPKAMFKTFKSPKTSLLYKRATYKQQNTDESAPEWTGGFRDEKHWDSPLKRENKQLSSESDKTRNYTYIYNYRNIKKY
jgi:hypothetical protein